MSGKITLKTRIGKTKDPKYDHYVEWIWEVEGEDGTTISLSPSYDDLRELLVQAFVHELINDRLRNRNPDEIVKRRKFKLDPLLQDAQRFVQSFGDDADLVLWLKDYNMDYIVGNRMNERAGRNLCNYLYDKIANEKARAAVGETP